MGNDSLDIVRPERAALAPNVPIRLVHEVIYDELAAAAKEVRQSLSAVLAFEYVLLLHALPGQLAPLPAELFAQAREFLLSCEEAPAGGDPVVVTYDLLVGHGTLHRKCPFSLSARPCLGWRTRRGGATRRPSRCAPWVRGRATGTCPRGRPVRAHKWSRCGRRRRPRARTRSCPASRACRWPRRFRSWPRSRRQAPRRVWSVSRRSHRLALAGSCIRRFPCAVAPR